MDDFEAEMIGFRIFDSETIPNRFRKIPQEFAESSKILKIASVCLNNGFSSSPTTQLFWEDFLTLSTYSLCYFPHG